MLHSDYMYLVQYRFSQQKTGNFSNSQDIFHSLFMFLAFSWLYWTGHLVRLTGNGKKGSDMQPRKISDLNPGLGRFPAVLVAKKRIFLTRI